MKITPSNQTLILAGERRGPGNSSDSSPGKAAASNSAILQRVTIVASQPDSTVLYLRADYSPAAGAPYAASPTYAGRRSSGALPSLADAADARQPSGSTGAYPTTALVPQGAGATARRDGYGNALTVSRDTGLSAFLKPAELYAQTQRILGASARVQEIDVHA